MAAKPIKVSQLTNYIKRILQTDPLLGNISVIGEISNLKHHDSGHIYFTLKDEKSRINCFLPRERVPGIRYELDEGMEITAAGHVSVYEKGGYYSLMVSDIQVEGQGDLAIAFDKLKQKLEKEGLFAASHKKPLPYFPLKIALVTSQTGAAVADMVKIITKRNNVTDILIYPVTVQGPGAAAEISSAIDDINTDFPETDIIITGRGGGSAEELWAFNEELVARSIYASKIPVISAVGHETDFTIADFTADARGETPTAAAIMAAPDTSEIRETLDYLMETLKESLTESLKYREERLKTLDLQVFRRSINERAEFFKYRADSLIRSNSRAFSSMIGMMEERKENFMRMLEDLNPKNIMRKGYSVITDENGGIINSTGNLAKDQQVTLIMADGEADSLISKVRRNKK